MSAGLFGLLDDVAALAKLAAASVDDIGSAAGRATTKAAGVVVDDTAVTPQFVEGVHPDRELPIVRRIAMGSIRNKLLIILPIALVLSQWAEWLLTPILMVGGCYLAYEGAEKVWERIRGHEHAEEATPVARGGAQAEAALVAGAIRTDLILSAEIMVIALNEVSHLTFWSRLAILAFVAIVITIAVYGVVGLIVKMDDLGLHLARHRGALAQRVGRGLVAGMPRLLEVISVVGVVAMLWVGGHILVSGADRMGWHAPFSLVHHLEHHAEHATGAVGGVVGWLVETLCSAVVGLVVGMAVLGVLHWRPRRRSGDSGGDDPRL